MIAACTEYAFGRASHKLAGRQMRKGSGRQASLHKIGINFATGARICSGGGPYKNIPKNLALCY